MGAAIVAPAGLAAKGRGRRQAAALDPSGKTLPQERGMSQRSATEAGRC